GKLHTGDLARRDEEGFIYIVDRAKDFIKCGGTRTSTKALEETFLKFEDIVEAAVMGIPDEFVGEAVAGFMLPKDPRGERPAARFQTLAQSVLEPPLVPRLVKALPALPKNNAGKVLKAQLKGFLDPSPPRSG